MHKLPLPQELEQMRKRLPLELEKRLKPKCLAILSYYHPESGKMLAGDMPRNACLRGSKREGYLHIFPAEGTFRSIWLEAVGKWDAGFQWAPGLIQQEPTAVT